jgi:ketosteroid isomerase-like protein
MPGPQSVATPRRAASSGSGSRPWGTVDRPPHALELVGSESHVVLGMHDESREELAGVELHGRLFTVFTVRDGQIVQLRDYAHRAEALAAAGHGDHEWR